MAGVSKRNIKGAISLLIVALLMFCIGLPQAAGQVQEEWVVRHNGKGNDRDWANDIVVDGAGNICVTGYSRAGRSSSSADCTTIKYNPGGDRLWIAYYDGSGNRSGDDLGEAIAVDSSGNVYVAGYSRGSNTDLDYVTIKYDTNGNQLWAAHYNGPGDGPDTIRDIALDSSGNVYVTGLSHGSDTDEDYATIKYDTNGNELWVARYNGPENGVDSPTAMAVDKSGNVHVTGLSTGTDTGWDYAAIKYDTNGNELWVARYTGPGNDLDYATAIAVDRSGSVYVTGKSSSSDTGLDYATIKYNSAGNELWVRRYNGPRNGDDDARAIAVDKSSNVHVTGYSGADYATIKYDTNGNESWVARYGGLGKSSDAQAITLDKSGNVYVTGFDRSSFSRFDYATIKYDAAGNELWATRYDDYHDRVEAIAVDAACNVYVTGFTEKDSSSDWVTIKYSQDSQMGDLGCDNDVDMADLALLAANWLETDCGLCGGADLSGDRDVDMEDFAIFGTQADSHDLVLLSVLDDFEQYDAYNPIWENWRDGLGFVDAQDVSHPGNGTGSAVGDDNTASVTEETIIHGGSQSMPFTYDNTGSGGKAHYSEIERTWNTPQDWTRNGIKAFNLWFHGDPDNDVEQFYVAVQDSAGKIKVVNCQNSNAALIGAWREWKIDMKEFSNAGVNLRAVKKIYIGLGDRGNPKPGGTGIFYIDDIRLYRAG